MGTQIYSVDTPHASMAKLGCADGCGGWVWGPAGSTATCDPCKAKVVEPKGGPKK